MREYRIVRDGTATSTRNSVVADDAHCRGCTVHYREQGPYDETPGSIHWWSKIGRTVSVVAVALWCFLVAAQQSSADEAARTALDDAIQRFERLERKAARDLEAGITPLHAAVVQRDIAALEAALRSGALVNQPDAIQRTPLYLAAERGDVRAIELLLKAGARVDAEWAPLSGAAGGGHVAAIEALLNAGATITGEELGQAAWGGSVPAIRALLEVGMNVNAPYGIFEETPLHRASWAGQPMAIEALLNAGANINARTSLGYTPLHVVAQLGKVEATQTLLEAGADVNAQDNGGQTPLGAARESMNETLGSIIPYQEVIEILRRHGGQ